MSPQAMVGLSTITLAVYDRFHDWAYSIFVTLFRLFSHPLLYHSAIQTWSP